MTFMLKHGQSNPRQVPHSEARFLVAPNLVGKSLLVVPKIGRDVDAHFPDFFIPNFGCHVRANQLEDLYVTIELTILTAISSA